MPRGSRRWVIQAISVSVFCILSACSSRPLAYKSCHAESNDLHSNFRDFRTRLLALRQYLRLLTLIQPAMDSYFTIAFPVASEQPEVPRDEEGGSRQGTMSQCVIA